MHKWCQYSIGKDWPIEKIDTLPRYGGRWHYLFEPQLLVRVEGLTSLPQGAVWGDTSKDRTGCPGGGKIWPGDVDFYLTEDLHEAILDFLHANSKMVQVMRSDGRNTFKWRRKATHLLCNQFGMGYRQECWFYLRSALRSFYLWFKYGSQ